MKYISIISVLLITRLEATRLLQTATCAYVDCKPNHNCYDTSTGPVCCDPSICATGGLCNGIAGIECSEGYECVDNPMFPCDPTTTSDCAGICVNPNTLPVSLPPTAATCASTLCIFGTQCYETSNGPVCCDPNICEKGTCGGNGINECELGYECVVGNCPKGMTDCPGICIHPNIQPTEGDSCTGCPTPRCACVTCPDGEGQFGCCGDCQYKYTANGQLLCAPVITNRDVCAPAVGEPCGQQGIDCGGIRAASFTCTDGTCWGNCGTCVYEEDAFGSLYCAPAFIPKEDVCPCAGLENCDSYTPDGCNTCGCPKDGTHSFCTLGACPPEMQTRPECRICSDGYTLNPLTKQCEPTLTCANVLCVFGETCYETSNGPACCDADICQKWICGTRGGFECAVGYECVEDPLQTCDPVTTADCPGVCVDIDAQPTVGCGVDHCNSYFDGCNDCECNLDGAQSCTEKACKQLLDPYCTGCAPGFILNPNTNQCEGCICPAVHTPVCCNGITYSNNCVAACQQASGPCSEGSCPNCGGFANCINYYDGCNDCVCGENGFDACTKKACALQGKPKCNECEWGYRVNDENGECVRKTECNGHGHCDQMNGYRCVNDPICRGQSNNFLCENASKICFDYEGAWDNCESDFDCDTQNGFKCFRINDGGVGVCGRYE